MSGSAYGYDPITGRMVTPTTSNWTVDPTTGKVVTPQQQQLQPAATQRTGYVGPGGLGIGNPGTPGTPGGSPGGTTGAHSAGSTAAPTGGNGGMNPVGPGPMASHAISIAGSLLGGPLGMAVGLGQLGLRGYNTMAVNHELESIGLPQLSPMQDIGAVTNLNNYGSNSPMALGDAASAQMGKAESASNGDRASALAAAGNPGGGNMGPGNAPAGPGVSASEAGPGGMAAGPV